MGFITKGPFCRQRVGMFVVWPSRTPSTRREACVRDMNGRSGGVVVVARASDDDALTAFACVRPRRARDRGVHVRGGDGAGEREQSNAASEREVWVVVRDARRRRLR